MLKKISIPLYIFVICACGWNAEAMTINVTEGKNVTVPAGSIVPIEVQVLDENEDPVSGIEVRFEEEKPFGPNLDTYETFEKTVVTDSEGKGRIEFKTMEENRLGGFAYIIVAQVGEQALRSTRIETVVGSPATVQFPFARTEFTYFPNSKLDVYVFVRDEYENFVEDEEVNLSVISGDVAIDKTSFVTDEYGFGVFQLETGSDVSSGSLMIRARSKSQPDVFGDLVLNVGPRPIGLDARTVMEKVKTNYDKWEDRERRSRGLVEYWEEFNGKLARSFSQETIVYTKKPDKGAVQNLSPDTDFVVSRHSPLFENHINFLLNNIDVDAIGGSDDLQLLSVRVSDHKCIYILVDFNKGVILVKELTGFKQDRIYHEITEYLDHKLVANIWTENKKVKTYYNGVFRGREAVHIYSDIEFNKGLSDDLFESKD